MRRSALLLFLLSGIWVQAGATMYKIDPEHSTVAFHIHHLIGKVTGHFDRFQGTVDYEAGKPASWKTSATIEAASINTQSAKRDTHLRSEDFFDVEQFFEVGFDGVDAAVHGEVEELDDGEVAVRVHIAPATRHR